MHSHLSRSLLTSCLEDNTEKVDFQQQAGYFDIQRGAFSTEIQMEKKKRKYMRVPVKILAIFITF